MKKIVLILLLLITSLNVHAAKIDGYVNAVYVDNLNWQGFMVQLVNEDGLIVTITESCGAGYKYWAYSEVNGPLDSALLSLYLTAKATKERVTIYTYACHENASGQKAPLIAMGDLGIRQ